MLIDISDCPTLREVFRGPGWKTLLSPAPARRGETQPHRSQQRSQSTVKILLQIREFIQKLAFIFPSES